MSRFKLPLFLCFIIFIFTTTGMARPQKPTNRKNGPVLYYNLHSCMGTDYQLSAYGINYHDDYYYYDYTHYYDTESVIAQNNGIDFSVGMRLISSGNLKQTHFYFDGALCNILHGFIVEKQFDELTNAHGMAGCGLIKCSEICERELSFNFYKPLKNSVDGYSIQITFTHNQKLSHFNLGGTVGVLQQNLDKTYFFREYKKFTPQDQRFFVSFRITGQGKKYRPYLEWYQSIRLDPNNNYYSTDGLRYLLTGLQFNINEWMPVNNARFLAYPKYIKTGREQ